MFIELIPWRPFGRELGTLRKEVDDLFSRFFGEFPLTRKIAEEWAPRVDVSETNDSYVVKAELPGLEAKDVEEKDEHHHSIERYYGSFQRSFQVPVNLKTDKIEAAFDKVVLKVTLAKTEEAKKKEIEVKVK